MGEEKKPVTVLEKVTTVGELIKQLQQFDEATPFDPHQYLAFIHLKDQAFVSFTEIQHIP